MERGIVLSPKFVKVPTGHVIFESAIDDFELRKYLTYWDEIDVPRNTLVDFDCRQFRILEAAGQLKRTDYGIPQQFIGVRMQDSHRMFIGKCNASVVIDDCTQITLDQKAGDQIIAAHEDVFTLRHAQDPGKWSKAQVSSHLMASNYVDKESIEMELYNLLPVPAVNTPLEDIIEFKEKRHDQLIEFRLYLDELYQSILTAGDIPRAKNTAMNRLEQSLIGVNRTMKEAKINYVLDSLRSIKADITGIAGMGLGGAGIASFIGMSPILAGMAFTGLGIASKLIPQSKNSIPNELVYLKSVRKKFRRQ